ncbi:hypothetical protein TNIN_245011 [Trichonephila inaurata madagascariensis]|uniref:Uncharacterized protein n=1 Tax=Trichonephila inaurata madagascariensis TaxID=2747483 RepID=A0A8X7CHN9_9ARAC|nr:hypothetical protein TNIN_245011 [Trichonephila inaurata madagascariensis]
MYSKNIQSCDMNGYLDPSPTRSSRILSPINLYNSMNDVAKLFPDPKPSPISRLNQDKLARSVVNIFKRSKSARVYQGWLLCTAHLILPAHSLSVPKWVQRVVL